MLCFPKIQEWLVINNKRTPPEKEFFPKPEQRTDGSYIYERIPSVGGDSGTGQGRQQMLYKKRAYEEKPVDSTQATPSKVIILKLPFSTFTLVIHRLASTRAEATVLTRSHPRVEVSTLG